MTTLETVGPFLFPLAALILGLGVFWVSTRKAH